MNISIISYHMNSIQIIFLIIELAVNSFYIVLKARMEKAWAALLDWRNYLEC